MKLPSFQFYPGDWFKDPDLRRCSKAAKGVWIDMICLSFECKERGVFSAGGQPWTDQEIAAALGGDIAENLSAIAELLAKGVCSRNDSGAIFCRRVVRDEQIRRVKAANGEKGGRPKSKRKPNLKAKSKLNETTSSSSSSSTSSSPSGDCKNSSVFVRPTVDDVRSYCTERRNSVDPEAFHAYYTAQGWKLSNGLAMKDWRQAVITWEKRDANRSGAGVARHGAGRTLLDREHERERQQLDAIRRFSESDGSLPAG